LGAGKDRRPEFFNVQKKKPGRVAFGGGGKKKDKTKRGRKENEENTTTEEGERGRGRIFARVGGGGCSPKKPNRSKDGEE